MYFRILFQRHIQTLTGVHGQVHQQVGCLICHHWEGCSARARNMWISSDSSVHLDRIGSGSCMHQVVGHPRAGLPMFPYYWDREGVVCLDLTPLCLCLCRVPWVGHPFLWGGA